MFRKRIHFILIALLTLVVFVGCESSEVDGGHSEDGGSSEAEEVTVRVWNGAAGIHNEELWEELVFEPVQAHHPHISFEIVEGALAENITAGVIPDIIFDAQNGIFEHLELGLVGDLNPFVDERNIDLSRFDESILGVLDRLGKEGELYGIPFGMNYGMLLFDKDIFDRFGVAYPVDDMTWDEVIQVARELTIEEDGVQYVGMEPAPPVEVTRAAALPQIDEETEEALFISDEYGQHYAQVFDLLKQMYDIPGATRYTGEGNPIHGDIGQFVTEIEGRQVAMVDGWLAWWTSSGPGFEEATGRTNWDVVSYPQFEHNPGFGRNVDFHMMIVPPDRENKEAIYDVLETLTSDEVQAEMNRHSRITVLDDDAMRAQHASVSNLYEGKNLEGAFSITPSTLYLTPYTTELNAVVNEYAMQMSTENVDVNTALRRLNEQANIVIEEVKEQRQ